MEIKRGLLETQAASMITTFDRPIALISDENVAQLYASHFCQQLKHAGTACELFTFPPGESSKSQKTVTNLQESLLKAGFGRDSAIIAMGGGVVTDLAGFVASTYCRGIPLILVPTSLLAMVDASIGGKTGINLPQSKNFIGTFYQPEAILTDPHVLQTQPLESFRDGLVEMIKHGLIWDVDHFEWIEHHLDQLIEKDPDILEKGIVDSSRIKQSIVLQDPKEKGLRRIVNYGHTIGHAIESASNYTISHGSAVAIGILVEGVLSGLCSRTLDRLFQLFRRIGISFESLPSLDAVMHALCYDKKAVKSVPRFVTLIDIGKVHSHEGEFCKQFEQSEIEKALEIFVVMPFTTPTK